MVTVYRFHEAPKELQELSPHGGDEDYIVVGRDDNLAFTVAEKLTFCDCSEHFHEGSYVYITAHA